VDLTFLKRYSAICGFTIPDLEAFFKDHIQHSLKELKASSEADLMQKIRSWYDGYSWDGITKVLNPISVLQFFQNSLFAPYWAKTNPSFSFLATVGENNPAPLARDRFDNVPEEEIEMINVREFDLVAVLFQTGYLTIDRVDETGDDKRIFSLKTPNWEIQKLGLAILRKWLKKCQSRHPAIDSQKFIEAIRDKNSDKLTEIISSLYLSLPAEHHRNGETRCHTLLHGCCRLATELVQSEHKGGTGSSDLVVHLDKHSTCAAIELKYGCYGDEEAEAEVKAEALAEARAKAKDKAEAEAITQVRIEKERLKIAADEKKKQKMTELAENALSVIDAKKYHSPHGGGARKVIKIGVGVVWRGECVVLAEK
jgi:hypothetical protein